MLMSMPHRKRTQNADLNEAVSCIQEAAGKKDVPDDALVERRDQRQPILWRDCRQKVEYETCHGITLGHSLGAMNAGSGCASRGGARLISTILPERFSMDLNDRGRITWQFGAE